MANLWDGRRVVVCVGTGGVGKTTVSATLAVAAAAAGKKTLVMTIDPARRLAQALGLRDVGNQELAIDPALLAAQGVRMQGSLHVMMPDVKGTFDGLVARWAPDAAARDAILNNRIYQHFSTALAGSHEYAAVEKLYEVYDEKKYDLIVLDTPPSQNAIDFLEAPNRIVDFLESDAFNWLIKPTMFAGKMSLRLLDFGGNFLFKSLGRVAGAETLRELSEFLLSFQGMYDGFRDRSRKVRELLASEEVAFVLVGTPQPNQRQAMDMFQRELAAKSLSVRGVIINRVRQAPYAKQHEAVANAAVQRVLDRCTEAERTALINALHEEAALAARDAATVESVRADANHIPVVALPELPLDAHDLASLARLHTTFIEAQPEDTPRSPPIISMQPTAH